MRRPGTFVHVGHPQGLPGVGVGDVRVVRGRTSNRADCRSGCRACAEPAWWPFGDEGTTRSLVTKCYLCQYRVDIAAGRCSGMGRPAKATDRRRARRHLRAGVAAGCDDITIETSKSLSICGRRRSTGGSIRATNSWPRHRPLRRVWSNTGFTPPSRRRRSTYAVSAASSPPPTRPVDPPQVDQPAPRGCLLATTSQQASWPDPGDPRGGRPWRVAGRRGAGCGGWTGPRRPWRFAAPHREPARALLQGFLGVLMLARCGYGNLRAERVRHARRSPSGRHPVRKGECDAVAARARHRPSQHHQSSPRGLHAACAPRTWRKARRLTGVGRYWVVVRNPPSGSTWWSAWWPQASRLPGGMIPDAQRLRRCIDASIAP